MSTPIGELPIGERPIGELPIGSFVSPVATSHRYEPCLKRPGSTGRCFRRQGHGGRHAFIGGTGRVWDVWGDDVHQAARERGRAALTEKANERLTCVVDLIAGGAEPDDAWASVEQDAARAAS